MAKMAMVLLPNLVAQMPKILLSDNPKNQHKDNIMNEIAFIAKRLIYK